MKCTEIIFHTADNEDKIRLGRAIDEVLSGCEDYIYDIFEEEED